VGREGGSGVHFYPAYAQGFSGWRWAVKGSKRILVISAGTTPEPIEKSIQIYNPDEVIFFVSEESKKTICEKVLSKFPTLFHDFVFTPDHEDLEVCYEALRKTMRETDDSEIIVDFTGGTKVMSVALSIWALSRGGDMSYIGGERDREVPGARVIDGRESPRSFFNPWRVMAKSEIERLAERFNSADFYAARKIAEDIKENPLAKRSVRDLATHMVEVANFFLDWDNFNYNSSFVGTSYRAGVEIEKMGAYIKYDELEKFGTRLKEAVEYYKNLQEHWKNLNQTNSAKMKELLEKDGPILVYDLIANAKRRAYCEGRPDDAIMRLYSAVEKMGKIRLLALGFNNSNLDLEALGGRGIDTTKYEPKIGLEDTYRLLDELGDPVGKRYANVKEELGKFIGHRNSSYLVHGTESSNEDLFKRALGEVLSFLQVDSEKEEFEFPRIPEDISEVM
ncbi:MAG: TIGR02710 family CRISPR-associated CARF protein, partial [candidate division WOR-3 bacterium]